MNFRSDAIAMIDRIAVRSGVNGMVSRRYGGAGCAIMLHSLVPSAADYLYQDIRFPRDALERMLVFCRRHDIDILDIDEALDRLGNGGKPFVVFTFDDGYLDNLEIALPLFRQYGAKLTVFVTTGMITRSIDYWWGGLLDVVKRQDVVDAEPLGLSLASRTIAEKQSALQRLTRWVEANVAERSPQLAGLFTRYGTCVRDLVDQEALSVRQLRELASSPLVTIGGHTVSHSCLASLSAEEAVREIVENRSFLEESIDQEVAHFAYPHGDTSACGPRDAALLKANGFRSGFSTRKGGLFPTHQASPFMLPRGSMNPRRSSIPHFRAQLSGLHRCLVSRCRTAIEPSTLHIPSI